MECSARWAAAAGGGAALVEPAGAGVDTNAAAFWGGNVKTIRVQHQDGF